jgi:hypothetical protein
MSNRKELEAKEEIKKKITTFRKNHSGFIYCKKISGRQSIFICDLTCRGCSNFDFERYLCQDLSCQNISICFESSQVKRKKYCEKFNLTKERNQLRRKYRAIFSLHRIYRLFETDPKKALEKYNGRKEKQLNKKKEDLSNGKISAPKDVAKNKRSRASKKNTNTKSVKRKAINKGSKKRKKN